MLYQEQYYVEMMHMVPDCASSTHNNDSFVPTASSVSANSFDFDLDLLDSCEVPLLELPLPEDTKSSSCSSSSSSDFGGYLSSSSPAHSTCSSLNQQVPSPSHTLSPLEATAHSPTMFSPMDPTGKSPALKGPDHHGHHHPHHGHQPRHHYAPLASPVASVPSPVACRPDRLSSTDSVKTVSSSASSYLQESLAEFHELQNKLKFERESSLSSPPPYPAAAAAGTSSSSSPPAAGTTRATVQVKIEPLDGHRAAAAAGMAGDNFSLNFSTGSTSSGAGAIPPPPAYQEKGQQEEDDVCIKMEPVLSLAMEQVKSDIASACTTLNIMPNPSTWSQADVAKWLRWTMQQYNIPSSSPHHAATIEQWSQLGGHGFAQLTEEDFRQRFNQQEGESMYAQLDIWRSTSGYVPPSSSSSSHHNSPPSHFGEQGSSSSSIKQEQQPAHRPVQKEDSFDISSVLHLLDNKDESFAAATTTSSSYNPIHSPASVASSALSPPPPYPMYDHAIPSTSGLSHHHQVQQQQQQPTLHTMRVPEQQQQVFKTEPEDFDEDEDELMDTKPSPSSSSRPAPKYPHASSATPPRPPTSGRSTSNIHLWQFVKELLNQPHMYSGCIHWIDRERGIFKIVDSNRVATLWGKRKNRPAMNYDKLSRSLRQYYKKGIMKKTERTQRLVYQFCPPYHL